MLLILLTLGAVSVLGVVPPAHAAGTTISITTSNGSTVCSGSLGGTWDAGTDTCSFSSGLTINSTTTLDIGAGVTVDGYGSWYAIVNSGTISNNGTIKASGGTGGTGDFCGDGGTGGSGIVNQGAINNEWFVTGTGGTGGTGRSNGGSGAGIHNPAAINDYCGAILSYSSYDGNTPNTISCYTVTFDQSGIPTSGVTWGITISWGPFVLPQHYTGTGASIAVFVVGSLTYSYDSPVPGSGVTYVCQSGCSGTAAVSGATTFSASYTSSSTPPTGVPEFPLGLALLFALVVPALLVLRKKAVSLRGLSR